MRDWLGIAKGLVSMLRDDVFVWVLGQLASAARLTQMVEGSINNHHDVDALCRSFPTRLRKFIANEGGGSLSVLTP